jgi:hypothetical protein
MIVFDLACDAGHVFEAWFGSTDDYEGQRARGLVSCPMCGAKQVAKAVMAPNVGPKGNQAPASPNVPVPMQAGALAPADMKAMLSAMAKVQAEMLSTSEHVGHRFADEARAMHLGDAPERAIHGQATPEEARSLVEDGVPVAALPLPFVPPEAAN